MTLPFHIIQLLKRKSGNELRLPSDCEYLSLDIESKTGVRIGATTLKRLIGFAQDERTPHTSTLDAIACYLGYAHWDELSRIEDNGNSDFDSPDDEIRSADLQPGTCVEIAYLPDRRLTLKYLGDSRYRVTDSENSKLQKGDEVEILNFVLHHPLLVVNVSLWPRWWQDSYLVSKFLTYYLQSSEKHLIFAPIIHLKPKNRYGNSKKKKNTRRGESRCQRDDS